MMSGAFGRSSTIARMTSVPIPKFAGIRGDL
jgi:hypothetical protein